MSGRASANQRVAVERRFPEGDDNISDISGSSGRCRGRRPVETVERDHVEELALLIGPRTVSLIRGQLYRTGIRPLFLSTLPSSSVPRYTNDNVDPSRLSYLIYILTCTGPAYQYIVSSTYIIYYMYVRQWEGDMVPMPVTPQPMYVPTYILGLTDHVMVLYLGRICSVVELTRALHTAIYIHPVDPLKQRKTEFLSSNNNNSSLAISPSWQGIQSQDSSKNPGWALPAGNVG